MNNDYVDPTTDWLPPHRLGKLGDAQKVNCETCHQGAYKPLLGANMIKDYPNLARLAQPEPEAPAEEASEMPEARIWLTWQQVVTNKNPAEGK